MTARIIRFPEIYPAHTPREAPGAVLILPVVRVDRESPTNDGPRRVRPDFVTTAFPLIDGSLTRGLDE
ncbi:hypothetical protein [Bradyrhizobium sp.]|uniref:hypothetical protein n=1 Tax=Bradyrhizobium sp. TaxID=376 RepID=UPI0039E4299C